LIHLLPGNILVMSIIVKWSAGVCDFGLIPTIDMSKANVAQIGRGALRETAENQILRLRI